MADLSSLPVIEQAVAAFRAQYERELALKVTRNPVLTISDAVQKPVGQWGNWVDGMLAQLQADVAERIVDGQVRLGATTIHRVTASPAGSLAAPPGDIALDGVNGAAYLKATGTDSSGWSSLGGGAHYESFGFDTATSSTDVWVPFGPHLIDQVQSSPPRAYHVWSVPFAGTVSTIRAVSEGDPGTTTVQFYQPDGSTTIGVAGTGTPSVVSGTSGANTLYQCDYTFATPVSLTAGQRVILGYNMTSPAGEVVGSIELSA